MLLDEGVEVRVVANGRPLTEYAVPASDEHSALCAVEKYIEAQSGTTFAIHARWPKGFRLHRASHLKLVFRIDGEAFQDAVVLDARPCLSVSGDVLERDLHGCITECSPQQKGNGWFRHAFSFAETPIDENLQLSPQELRRHTTFTGSIKIETYRVIPLGGPRPAQHQVFGVPTTSLHKKAAMKAVSHTFSPGEARRLACPPPRENVYLRIPGPLGENREGAFHYRSLRALQMLGCIPTSPRRTAQAASRGSSAHLPARAAPHEAGTAPSVKVEPLDQQDGAQDGTHRRALLEQIANLQAQVDRLDDSGEQRIKREPVHDGNQPRPAKRARPEVVVLDD